MPGTLRSWLNSWRGIGDVERGRARQGYDLQLTRYDARRITGAIISAVIVALAVVVYLLGL